MSDNDLPTQTEYLRKQAIKPKTKAMETLLSLGYGMSLEKARQIIKEREANPQSWPYEMYEKAKAFIEAYEATPEVVSTDPGWKRDKRREG